jgi:hypothetical protein
VQFDRKCVQMDVPQVGEVGDVVQTWPEGVAEAQLRALRLLGAA